MTKLPVSIRALDPARNTQSRIYYIGCLHSVYPLTSLYGIRQQSRSLHAHTAVIRLCIKPTVTGKFEKTNKYNKQQLFYLNEQYQKSKWQSTLSDCWFRNVIRIVVIE